MMDISKGRYWDLPWSLVDGCTPCSPGCEHCWSAAMGHRWGHFVDSDGDPTLEEGGRFTGLIKTRPDRLSIALKRRKPTVWAVWNDLFHEDVPVNFLEDALAVMTQCPQHTFLVLTKRAQRLNLMTQDRLRVSRTDTWPIKNLRLGLTICNQQEADEKLSIFMQVFGLKWLSIEPMLSKVIIPFEYRKLLSGVVLGGETGPGARPLHLDWVRSVRDQCQSAGVPFFLKSSMGKRKTYWSGDIEAWGNMTPELSVMLEDGHIGNYPLWRMIDGKTHDELPWRSYAV